MATITDTIQTVTMTPSDLVDSDIDQGIPLVQILEVAAQGFRQGTADLEDIQLGFITDVHQHVIAPEKLILINTENGCEGFICAQIIETPQGRVFHLQGMILSDNLKDQKYGTAILRAVIEEKGADILAFHTANRAMERVGNKIDLHDPSLALQIAEEIGTDMTAVDISLGVVIQRRRYGTGGLYGTPLASQAVAEINELNGDALVFACRVQYES